MLCSNVYFTYIGKMDFLSCEVVCIACFTHLLDESRGSGLETGKMVQITLHRWCNLIPFSSWMQIWYIGLILLNFTCDVIVFNLLINKELLGHVECFVGQQWCMQYVLIIKKKLPTKKKQMGVTCIDVEIVIDNNPKKF